MPCPSSPDRLFAEFVNNFKHWGNHIYALTNNWIVGLEYNYMDFGKKTRTISMNAGADLVTDRIKSDQHSVLARLTYKFGGPSAVVAKY